MVPRHVLDGAQDTVTAATSQGMVKLSPTAYAEFAQAARPDIVELLADHLPASHCNPSRVRKSVDRTLAWADDQLQQLLASRPALALPDADTAADGDGRKKRARLSAPSHSHAALSLFGSVQGGGIAAERVRCARELAKRAELAGFTLGGFGLGESPSDRMAMLRAVVAELPPEKPRLVPSTAEQHARGP
eukprot:COSAG01_NODE_22534_length_851_cov_1.771277_1_plen_189_part_10